MIHFRNPGAIDLRALTTFGLSSKAGQDKIGRFGTGLKYATAVIARHGGAMTITSGGETVTTGIVADEFRGTPIQQITLDGHPLPFTTDLGKDWEPWMAFRELYSNALDEGGDVGRSEGVSDPCGDETVISVSLDAFEAIFFSMEEHFIGRDEYPLWESKDIAVYRGKSKFIFYRGIAVMKLKEPAAFRYSLKGYLDLTEDRTAKYDWIVRSKIAEALARTTRDDIAQAASDNRNPYETTLDFSEVTDPSDLFIGAAVSHGAACNPTARALVQSKLPPDGSTATVLMKGAPGAEALRKALQTLRDIGADLTKAKFVLADSIPIFGDFDVRGDAVFLSEAVFDKPDRMTVAAVEGFAGIVGGNWMAKRLIAAAKEKPHA